LTELVGREEELELLLRRWSKAKTGERQVVLLSGEAGIGKSRLTAALLERLAADPHTRLRYFCSPQHTDSAFYPIISQMERATKLAHDDSAQRKLDKLDAVLAQTSTSIEDAALFAEMLSLPNDGRYPKLELTPEQRRQRTLAALTAQVETLSRQNPVLMIFEDAHWADPTSLELFGRIVDKILSHRVLLIITFRPEFDAPWLGRSHVMTLMLNRLGQRDIEAIIDSVVGNKLIPANIRQDIVERTDGVPLFVEEMTKAVLEAESEGIAQRTASAIPQLKLAVPASLHASLMSRLDRLGPAKQVAQIGAAIGREFSHALLSAVMRKPEPALVLALDRLLNAGLLFRQGVPPHATYLFKHALVQDAAYGTLLREPRRALHARIAETFESQFKEIAENQPELLARHYAEAGFVEKATGLWGKAGLRSLERSALVEAIEQLTRALDQAAVLPSTPALRQQQITLQIALINASMHLNGHAAPETKAATEQARLLIEQAEALGEPPHEPLLLFSVLFSLWVLTFNSFSGDLMRERAAQLLALAEKHGDTVQLMVAHRVMGLALTATGNIAKGRAHLDQAMALYEPTVHRPLATRFGQDVGVAILSFRSLALWVLGYPDRALLDTEHALRLAREIGQAPTLLFALEFHGSLLTLCGNYVAALAFASELNALADEKASPYWKAGGMMIQGDALTLNGNAADGIPTLITGITAWRSTGSTAWLPMFLFGLARAYADLHQFDEAWRFVDEAMLVLEETDERWCEAEVNRVGGQIALQSPAPNRAKAEAYFERALAVARSQQAKSWELRATMSMARLWRDQGKRDEARDLLAPVYGWFTEGFDTLDLKEAKALLEELAA
jgi:predicted ATPase